MTKKLKLYLSGASAEMPRVKAMIGQVIASGCLTLTHDWSSGPEWDVVPPVPEAELDVRLRQKLMADDVQGVVDADVFWLLAPSGVIVEYTAADFPFGSDRAELWERVGSGGSSMEEVLASAEGQAAAQAIKGRPKKRLFVTKGAWFELGVAHTLRMLRPWPGVKPTVIVSGPECYQSIFTEAAQHFFDTDMLALEWLKKKATSQ